MQTANQNGRVGRRGAVQMAASAAVAGAFLSRQPAAAQTEAPEPSIVGSWIQTVEGTVFRALQTFTADGGFIATTAQHLDRSPSHGAWTQTDDGAYLVTMQDMTVSAEEPNTLVSTSKVRLEITVDDDGQHYTSRGIREDFDLDGNLLRTEETTGEGSRIVAEPLG